MRRGYVAFLQWHRVTRLFRAKQGVVAGSEMSNRGGLCVAVAVCGWCSGDRIPVHRAVAGIEFVEVGHGVAQLPEIVHAAGQSDE